MDHRGDLGSEAEHTEYNNRPKGQPTIRIHDALKEAFSRLIRILRAYSPEITLSVCDKTSSARASTFSAA